MKAGNERLHVLLVGPYGGTNLGDDAIMTCILAELAAADVDVTISCSSPETVGAATGLPVVPLLDYRARETAVVRVLDTVDAVIIGGGQQLSQPRLPNPIWGLLARSCHMARLARARGKPTILWAVGLDWPLSAISAWMVRRWLGAGDATLLMRDEGSYRRMEQLLGSGQAAVHKVADVAFLFPRVDLVKGRAELCAELGHADAGQDYVILSPAHDKVSSTGYYSGMIEAGRALAGQGYRVVGWHTDLQDGYDMRLRQMPEWRSIPGFDWLPPKTYPTEQLAAMLGAARLLVTGRLHPAILAAVQGVSVVGIARSPKMTDILGEAGIPFVAAESCDGQSLSTLVTDVLEGRRVIDAGLLTRQQQAAAQGAKLVRQKLRQLQQA